MSARGLATTTHRRGDVLIGKALAMLDRRLRRVGEPLGSPYAVREFLQLHLAELEHEVFMVLFLDSQNRMIEWQEMFRGTVTQTSVYPREVVKAALALVDISVLDHFIVAGRERPLSFAEAGLL